MKKLILIIFSLVFLLSNAIANNNNIEKYYILKKVHYLAAIEELEGDYLEFGARETGWLFTYIGVCIVIVQAVLIRHIVARFGEIGAMGLGGLLLVGGQIMTVLALAGLLPGNGWPLVQTLLATTAICFGFAVASPALSSVASKVAGRSSRGGSLGVVQGFGSLGQVIGLVVAGPLYDLGGTPYPFSFGALVMLGMLAILPFLVRPTEE